MFDWTRSSWYLAMLILVLAAGGIAGIIRSYHRRQGMKESRAVLLYYNVATALLLLLAMVFMVRWIVEVVL
ncbi:MAG: hypothetical protein ACYC5A_01540 [Thermoleophilia bacterium]